MTLKQADALFVPGSDNPQYSASKIYPYLLSYKPLLTIFNSNSPIIEILNEFGSVYNYSYNKTECLQDKIHTFLIKIIKKEIDSPVYNKAAENKYSSKNMTKLQCEFFNQIINGKN